MQLPETRICRCWSRSEETSHFSQRAGGEGCHCRRQFMCFTVSAGQWPTCPGSNEHSPLLERWYFYVPVIPFLYSGVFFIFLCLYFKHRSYPSAMCALLASPTTFAFVIGLQMCFMIEQLLHTAAPPPRGVQQACLCKLSCCLFFKSMCGFAFVCIRLAVHACI